MTNTKRIAAVAFDYGGVISRELPADVLTSMAAAVGEHSAILESPDKDRFVEAVWNHRDFYDKGELTAEEYWHTVLIDSAPNAASSDEQEHALIEELVHLDAIGWSVVNPAMVRWMHSLRRNAIRMLIISNMSRELEGPLTTGRGWNDLMETRVISGNVGEIKPAPQIFEIACERMNLASGNLLFVDDRERNIEGARAAGMQAIHFVNPEQLASELPVRFPDLPTGGLEAVERPVQN